MSKNRYSRTEMYKLAETLTMTELKYNTTIANQDSHHCIHCFNCVCKEVYLNFLAVNDLAKDILTTTLTDIITAAKKSRDCER